MIKAYRYLLFGLTTLYGAQSWAQKPLTEIEPDGQSWFQIEVAIFSQRQSGAPTQEHWRKDIALAYPPNWVALRSPEAFLAEQLQASQSRNEPYSESGFETSGIEKSVLANKSYGTGPGQQTVPHDPATDTGSGNNAASVPVTVDLARDAYFFLPKEEHLLEAEVRQLRRDKRYRVLFHQSWRQPIVEEEKAPALLILGGNEFGDHHELEGSLTFSLSRYLHLKTNLWFSQFVTNYGQEADDWPELPPLPSLHNHDSNKPFFKTAEQGLWSTTDTSQGEYDSILAKPYVVNQVVALQQKRRMRSGEQHYIDHPLLGILVVVTHYGFPQEEQNNSAEQADTIAAPLDENI